MTNKIISGIIRVEDCQSFDNFKKINRKEKERMERHLLVRFNGCLNGRRKTKVNLLLLKSRVQACFAIHDFEHYLYQKRGRTKELGPKNGRGTSGYLEVIRINTNASGIPKIPNDYKTIEVCFSSIPKVYEQIKNELKSAIDEKIKIQKKKEIQKEEKQKKKGGKNV